MAAVEVKISVFGPNGQLVETEWWLRDGGDLPRAVSEAMELYQMDFPDAPPFEHKIKVELT